MNDKSYRQTLLIVDDAPENIDVLGGVLSDYRRLVALSGEKALKKAMSDFPPDLILLDIMMPDMDGYEVCQHLKARERTRDIPVIFITAKDADEDETRGFEMGAVDYITKPFSPPVVRARVKKHLELKRAYKKIEDQKQRLEVQNKALNEAARLREDVERLTRHDIKTPLSAIIGFSQLMMMDKNLSEIQMENLGMIEESGYRILNIINLSMDLLKMERGRYQLNPSHVNLLKVIDKITSELFSLARSKNLSPDVRLFGRPVCKEDIFSLWGEELLCYSMLANLIKNAIEASPEGERIGIDFADEAEASVIQIHNRGAVPGEIRDRFFEKYVSSGKKSGSGLGTYSARLIAETHGGEIRLASSEEDGTTVTIRIPHKKEI